MESPTRLDTRAWLQLEKCSISPPRKPKLHSNLNGEEGEDACILTQSCHRWCAMQHLPFGAA